MEYETHYYEFDSDGRYMDDWKTWHNDPKEAFLFLDRVFRGYHDLLRLGEYKLARKILDKACCPEFRVVEAEGSEDFEDDSPFTIADAAGERKFSMDIREIGHDCLEALFLEYGDGEEPETADKILEILQDATGGNLNPSDFGSLISDELLAYMEEALGEEIKSMDTRFGEFPEVRQY